MLFYDYTGIAAYHREMKKSRAISGAEPQNNSKLQIKIEIVLMKPVKYVKNIVDGILVCGNISFLCAVIRVVDQFQNGYVSVILGCVIQYTKFSAAVFYYIQNFKFLGPAVFIIQCNDIVHGFIRNLAGPVRHRIRIGSRLGFKNLLCLAVSGFSCILQAGYASFPHSSAAAFFIFHGIADTQKILQPAVVGQTIRQAQAVQQRKSFFVFLLLIESLCLCGYVFIEKNHFDDPP